MNQPLSKANQIFFSIAFSLFVFVGPSHSQPEAATPLKINLPVKRMTLANGLRVLVHEDPSIPLISYQQWFNVGARDEVPGRTGLAHFFEHLMFKGTQRYPPSLVDNIIKKNGGDQNAFTTTDVTAYYTSLPSSKLELIVDMESDRMRNLNLSEAQVNPEREVVKEERRWRYDSNPKGTLYLLVRQVVFPEDPYGRPVVGSMDDLNAASLADMRDFYQKYYAPNHAIVVVAGDVQADKVFSLVKKYYGHLPRTEVPATPPFREPAQKSQRDKTLRWDVQNTTFVVAFPAPGVGNDDVYALDLLSTILGSGESSRLHQRLVYRDQVSTGVVAYNDTDRLAGVFNVHVEMKPRQSMDSALGVVYNELYKMREGLVSGAELERAKNQVMRYFVDSLETVSQRAQAIAQAEALYGNYEAIFRQLEKYQSVTAADIQRVAKTYLLPEKRSVVRLVPKASATGG